MTGNKDTYEDKTLRYVVVDPTTNAIVMQDGAQERAHSASLAKLFTLTIAIEAAKHNQTEFGTTIKIREDIEKDVPDALANNNYIKPGSNYSFEDILFWTGSRSEGRATVALAEHLGKPSIYNFGTEHDEIRNNFLEYANQRLKEIGLKDTNTQVLTGWYNDDHYSTALDTAILIDYLQSNHEELARKALGGINPTNRRPSHSSELIKHNQHFEWGKTGFLRETGLSEAAYAQSKNQSREDTRPLIVVVTGFDGGARARERFVKGLLTDAYDVVNSDDYKPTSVYEDVVFDKDMPLPTQASTNKQTAEANTSSIPKIRPRSRPKLHTSEACDNPEDLPFTFQIATGQMNEASSSKNNRQPLTDENMFEAVNTIALYEKLKQEEGYSNSAYTDTEGKLTIGIGHLLDNSDNAILKEQEIKEGERISDLCIHRLYEVDSEKAINAAIRQARDIGRFEKDFVLGLVSVNFQLGENWPEQWPKAYQLLKENDFANAIIEFSSSGDGENPSKWTRQTHGRLRNWLEVLANEINEDLSKPSAEAGNPHDQVKDVIDNPPTLANAPQAGKSPIIKVGP